LGEEPHWVSRGHLLAAAESIRHIFVGNARYKRCLKGGGLVRRNWTSRVASAGTARGLLALDEALT
jgi:hypothetical protein